MHSLRSAGLTLKRMRKFSSVKGGWDKSGTQLDFMKKDMCILLDRNDVVVVSASFFDTLCYITYCGGFYFNNMGHLTFTGICK